MRLKSHTYLCKKLGGGGHTASVSVSSDGVFSVAIPRKLQAVMPERSGTKVSGKTLDSAISAFDKVVQEVEDASIEVSRIIACRFEATLVIEGDSGEYQDRLLHRDDISFQKGAAIAFACNVLDRMVIVSAAGEEWVRHTDVYSDEDHPFPRSFRREHSASGYWSIGGSVDDDSNTVVVPWTQEREDYFKDTCASFCALALRLDKTFAVKSAELIEHIDNNLLDEHNPV